MLKAQKGSRTANLFVLKPAYSSVPAPFERTGQPGKIHLMKVVYYKVQVKEIDSCRESVAAA